MDYDEDRLAQNVQQFVKNQLPLGVYDPARTRRPRVPVKHFEVEYLELDDSILHAAGPVTLDTSPEELTFHLRVSVPYYGDQAFQPEAARAAYIVELSSETGACKETAAIANAEEGLPA
jgi:hypothetical protein